MKTVTTPFGYDIVVGGMTNTGVRVLSGPIMKAKWIDEGRVGQPKIYTSKAWVLKLLKKAVTEDIELNQLWDGTDDELFRIGWEHLCIYEI